VWPGKFTITTALTIALHCCSRLLPCWCNMYAEDEEAGRGEEGAVKGEEGEGEGDGAVVQLLLVLVLVLVLLPPSESCTAAANSFSQQCRWPSAAAASISAYEVVAESESSDAYADAGAGADTPLIVGVSIWPSDVVPNRANTCMSLRARHHDWILAAARCFVRSLSRLASTAACLACSFW